MNRLTVHVYNGKKKSWSKREFEARKKKGLPTFDKTVNTLTFDEVKSIEAARNKVASLVEDEKYIIRRATYYAPGRAGEVIAKG